MGCMLREGASIVSIAIDFHISTTSYLRQDTARLPGYAIRHRKVVTGDKMKATGRTDVIQSSEVISNPISTAAALKKKHKICYFRTYQSGQYNTVSRKIQICHNSILPRNLF